MRSSTRSATSAFSARTSLRRSAPRPAKPRERARRDEREPLVVRLEDLATLVEHGRTRRGRSRRRARAGRDRGCVRRPRSGRTGSSRAGGRPRAPRRALRRASAPARARGVRRESDERPRHVTLTRRTLPPYRPFEHGASAAAASAVGGSCVGDSGWTTRYRRPDVGASVIRVCVAGITGWTGRPVADAIERADDLELVAGVSRSDPESYSSVADALDAVGADVLVDYTHATAVKANVLSAVERGVNAVVGSSGLSADDFDEIDTASRERGVGVVAAGNFSLTAAMLLRAATDGGTTPRCLGDHRLRERRESRRPERDGEGARRATRRRELAERRSSRGRRRQVLRARVGRPSPGRRCTRSVSPASSSRRRSYSRQTANASRFDTMPVRRRRRTSPGHSSRSARCPAGWGSRAGSIDCSSSVASCASRGRCVGAAGFAEVDKPLRRV